MYGIIWLLKISQINMKSKYVFLGFLLLFVLSATPIAAQEATVTPTEEVSATAEVISAENATALVAADEDVTAEDLEVAEPTTLPDSNFYFLKNWGRSLRTLVTIDPVKKTELNLKYANERLLEAKKLAEKTKDQTKIEKALVNYEKEKLKIQARIDKIKEDPARAEKISMLMDKLADKELKHQRLIDKMQKDMPEELKEKIQEHKEKALQIFSDTALSIDSPEKLRDRLMTAGERVEGSKFKHFKNLEVLTELENKVPERAREAIKQAQENALKRLHNDISAMSAEDKDQFAGYVGEISGDGITHAGLVQRLEEEQELPEDIKKVIEKTKEQSFRKIERRLSEIKDEKAMENYLKSLEIVKPNYDGSFSIPGGQVSPKNPFAPEKLEQLKSKTEGRLEGMKKNLERTRELDKKTTEMLREAEKDKNEILREMEKDKAEALREFNKKEMENLREAEKKRREMEKEEQ